MKNKDDAVCLACQIAYDYDNPGWEHVGDMLDTYEDETPPCDGDELMDLTNKATMHKDNGLSFQETHEKIMKDK